MAKLRLWNTKKINKLCFLTGRSPAIIYQMSLLWKFKSAEYHHKMATKLWEDLYQELKRSKIKLELHSKRWLSVELTSECEYIACIHVTRTMVDTLLQIINEMILRGNLHESEVTMRKVRKELKKINNAQKIFDKLNKLANSTAYRYIRSFDDLIKHRRLIHKTYTIRWNKNDGLKKGIRFEKFQIEYRGNRETFPAKWASDVTDGYRNEIVELIHGVISEMIRFLKYEKKSLAPQSLPLGSMNFLYDAGPW